MELLELLREIEILRDVPRSSTAAHGDSGRLGGGDQGSLISSPSVGSMGSACGLCSAHSWFKLKSSTQILLYWTPWNEKGQPSALSFSISTDTILRRPGCWGVRVKGQDRGHREHWSQPLSFFIWVAQKDQKLSWTAGQSEVRAPLLSTMSVYQNCIYYLLGAYWEPYSFIHLLIQCMYMYLLFYVINLYDAYLLFYVSIFIYLFIILLIQCIRSFIYLLFFFHWILTGRLWSHSCHSFDLHFQRRKPSAAESNSLHKVRVWGSDLRLQNGSSLQEAKLPLSNRDPRGQ